MPQTNRSLCRALKDRYLEAHYFLINFINTLLGSEEISQDLE